MVIFLLNFKLTESDCDITFWNIILMHVVNADMMATVKIMEDFIWESRTLTIL